MRIVLIRHYGSSRTLWRLLCVRACARALLRKGVVVVVLTFVCKCGPQWRDLCVSLCLCERMNDITVKGKGARSD